MVKKDPFKDKPKPPNREQILADLAVAASTDVVFVHQYERGLSDFQNTKGDPSTHSHHPHGQNSDQNETAKPDRATVNETYEQVTKLIQLHSQLKSEPKDLQEKYEHLEKLGQEVSTSISELKSAAESVMKKASD